MVLELGYDMDIAEAEKCLRRERSRWLPFAARLSDDELLRRRERLFNGLAMFFAFAILPSWFFGGLLGVYGQSGVIVGEIFAARHFSDLGNRCRDGREILRNRV